MAKEYNKALNIAFLFEAPYTKDTSEKISLFGDYYHFF